MLNPMEKLKTLFPLEVIDRLEFKKLSSGEIFTSYKDNKIFYILSGRIHGIKIFDNIQNYYPHRGSPGDFIGFNSFIIKEKFYWDFYAFNDTEVLIFPKDIIEKYILNDLSTYKYLVESTAKIWETGRNFYYIYYKGGAKASFAYYLVTESIDNIFYYSQTTALASGLNISRTRLFHIEREFLEKGLIEKTSITKDNKQIIILNKEGLMVYYRDFL